MREIATCDNPLHSVYLHNSLHSLTLQRKVGEFKDTAGQEKDDAKEEAKGLFGKAKEVCAVDRGSGVRWFAPGPEFLHS